MDAYTCLNPWGLSLAPSVHIFTLPGERFHRHYLLYHLVKSWRDQGINVSIGSTSSLKADVGIMHVDRTLVPQASIPVAGTNQPLLNGKILDISKRNISRHLVTPGDKWQGCVLIKTNANFYGEPERNSRGLQLLKRLSANLMGVFPWQRRGVLPPLTYPVLDHLKQVPQWVWDREDLVVEAFLPERAGNLYALRLWIFFGDREYSLRVFSKHPIVKAGRITHHEPLDQVPESLRLRRHDLKMDFGKFDYVLVNGEAVLLDANKTPTIAGRGTSSSRLLELSKGIHDYLSKAAVRC